MSTARRILTVLALVFAVALSMTPVWAQYVAPTPVEVAPSDTQQASPPAAVRGTRFERGLPVTGQDVLLFAVIGAGAVGAGLAVRRAARGSRGA